jgi:hypothetical protein
LQPPNTSRANNTTTTPRTVLVPAPSTMDPHIQSRR